MNDVTREVNLAKDLKTLLDDADSLLQHSVQGAGQEYVRARQRFEQSVLAAKGKLATAQDAVVTRAREAAESTDELVHRHPWESIGIAAAVGVAVGLLIGRR